MRERMKTILRLNHQRPLYNIYISDILKAHCALTMVHCHQINNGSHTLQYRHISWIQGNTHSRMVQVYFWNYVWYLELTLLRLIVMYIPTQCAKYNYSLGHEARRKTNLMKVPFKFKKQYCYTKWRWSLCFFQLN